MPMYNLIEHSNVYSKISGQCYRDEPALDNNNNSNFLIIMITIIIRKIIIIIKKKFSRIFQTFFLVPGTAAKQMPENNITDTNLFVPFLTLSTRSLGHIYMRLEVNPNRFEASNHFEMSFRLHGNLHGDFTEATFQTIARLYCTCANDIFYLIQT